MFCSPKKKMSGPVKVQVQRSSGQVLEKMSRSEALGFKIVSMSDSVVVVRFEVR